MEHRVGPWGNMPQKSLLLRQKIEYLGPNISSCQDAFHEREGHTWDDALRLSALNSTYLVGYKRK